MVYKVCLTGGPGTGKTSVIDAAYKELSKDYKVIIVPETVTYLRNMGLTFYETVEDFQEIVMSYQLFIENIVNRTTQMYPDKDIVVICDRGIVDSCAYQNDKQLAEVCRRLDVNWDINQMYERYDQVVALIGAKEFYTLENNPARDENYEKAKNLGATTIGCWENHPSLHIVGPQERIEDKEDIVINLIKENIESRARILKG